MNNLLKLTDESCLSKKIELYLYYCSQIIYGMSFFLCGPIIPFFSAESSLPQSAYLPFFTTRGIGFLIGGVLKNTLLSKWANLHQGSGICCLVVGISMLLMGITVDPFQLSILSFFYGIFFCILDIFLSICLLKFDEKEPSKYFSRGYAFQSFGGFLSPFILSIIGKSVLYLIGICGLLVGFVFFCFKDEKRKQERQTQNETPKQRLKPLNKKVIWGINLFLFLWPVIFHGYVTWLPIFLTHAQICTKEEGAKVVSLFVVTLILTRFILASCQPKKFFRITLPLIPLIYLLDVLFYLYGFHSFLLFISPVLLGIIMSMVCPFIYSFPIKFGFEVSLDSGAKFTTFNAIGHVTIASLAGYLMENVHPISVFVFTFFIALIARETYKFILKTLEEDCDKTKEESIQTELLQRT